MLLWALDGHLAGIVTATREGALGEIRLAWWREALAALPDKGPPKGEPILGGLAPLVTRAECDLLAGVADGWMALLEPLPLADDALARFAEGRGAGLFRVAGMLLGGSHPSLGEAGAGWALADLARHMSNAPTAARARELAGERLGGTRGRWPRSLRPLGMLAALARRDAGRIEAQGAPGRIFRAFWAGLTGY